MAPSQLDYFTSGSGTEEEKLLASSVQWTFNEALQVISEIGLIGFGLIITILGIALFAKLPDKSLRQFRNSVGAARATIIGLLVFGSFSYPFYSLPITILFFFSLAVISAAYIGNRHYKKNCYWLTKTEENDQSHKSFLCIIAAKIPMLLIIVLLGFFYFIQTPKLEQAYLRWDKAQTYYNMQKYEEANRHFEKAYYTLKNNGLFLQKYGKSLAMTGNYKEALEKIEEGGVYYKDSFWYITKGNCLKALGDNYEAEKSYLAASNMVPNRFFPLYLLAKLYDETNQQEKAHLAASVLLFKTVKVESKAISEIKKEMKEIIDKYDYNQH